MASVVRRMNVRRLLRPIGVLAAAVLCAACAGAPASPSPSPSPTPGAELSLAQLKYVLIDEYGPISWCDPDFYPIAVADEQQLAEQRLPEIRQDEDAFAAILQRLDLSADADLGPADKLAIYREWKLLNAIVLTQVEGDRYAFDLITETNPGLGNGVRTAGTIDRHRAIQVQLQEDTFLVSCPICLALGTLIDTPSGRVAVQQLRVGDLVWTLDELGKRVAAPLLRVGSTLVPASHEVVHVVLDDGRELWASPGHPTTDGRTAADLRPSDALDGGLVVLAELEPYSGGATFDILPAGATGYYWANGILLASTLR